MWFLIVFSGVLGHLDLGAFNFAKFLVSADQYPIFFLIGTEMAQLICGHCRTLLMYVRGATSVQCSCCTTVNLAMEGMGVNLGLPCLLNHGGSPCYGSGRNSCHGCLWYFSLLCLVNLTMFLELFQ
jgi:LSD1 subclass zinc finger protein